MTGLHFIAAVGCVFALAGCQGSASPPAVGQRVGNASVATGNALDRAGDATGNALQRTGDSIQRATSP